MSPVIVPACDRNVDNAREMGNGSASFLSCAIGSAKQCSEDADHLAKRRGGVEVDERRQRHHRRPHQQPQGDHLEANADEYAVAP